MTAVSEETDLSTFEVPTIPCDHQRHAEHGTGPAVWAVYYVEPQPCGCARRRNPVLLCDGCWRYMSSGVGGIVKCAKCKALMPLSSVVTKVVPL